jgi:hypothetical protein
MNTRTALLAATLLLPAAAAGAQQVPVVQALSVKNDATGAEVTDAGLPTPPPLR